MPNTPPSRSPCNPRLATRSRRGELLIGAKRRVQHGEWRPWLEANCTVPARTARQYIALARRRKRLCDQNGNVLPISVHAAMEQLKELRGEPMSFPYDPWDMEEFPSRNGRREVSWRHHQFCTSTNSLGIIVTTASAGVRAVMKGIRRTLGGAPTKKHAATADIVMKMLAQCDDSLIGRWDRALITVGMTGAFRHSELAALTTDDIETTKEGLLITIRRIRRSKGDQEGAGQVGSLPQGHHIRLVDALKAWLNSAGITSGLLFRSVALGQGDAMTGGGIARVVKKLIACAGLDRKDFSAHSLRWRQNPFRLGRRAPSPTLPTLQRSSDCG
jgi:integrase